MSLPEDLLRFSPASMATGYATLNRDSYAGEMVSTSKLLPIRLTVDDGVSLLGGTITPVSSQQKSPFRVRTCRPGRIQLRCLILR